MKLLFENWRKFLTEDEEATGAMPAHLDRKAKGQADKDALDKMGYQVLKELGRGQFGVVYQVENKQTGERLAAKIVKEADRETQNYQFAMDNKASMPEQYGKYLPEVYEIAPGPKGHNIILMEELKPLPPQVAQELFAMEDTPEASQKPQKILKNPEAVAEIAQKAVEQNRILLQLQVGKEVANAAVTAATKSPQSSIEELVSTVYGAVARAIDDQSIGIYKAIEKSLKQDIQYFFDKQIVPVHQPEPEEEDERDLWTGPSLEKTESLFPEAENLMKAMRYFMQDKSWRPKDVHIGNVMMRPGTNDFVIVDLGLFQRGIFEHKGR
jgi:serine/threonine protein kinase